MKYDAFGCNSLMKYENYSEEKSYENDNIDKQMLERSSKNEQDDETSLRKSQIKRRKLLDNIDTEIKEKIRNGIQELKRCAEKIIPTKIEVEEDKNSFEIVDSTEEKNINDHSDISVIGLADAPKKNVKFIKFEEGENGKILCIFDSKHRHFFADIRYKILKEKKNDEFIKYHYQVLSTLASQKNSKLLRVNKVLLNEEELVAEVEYGRGTLQSFKSFLSTKNLALSLQEILGLYKQLCEQVQELKKINLCHCNINPETIIIIEDGSFKLTDFRRAQFVISSEKHLQEIKKGEKYNWYYLPPNFKEALERGDSMWEFDANQVDMYSVKQVVNEILINSGRSQNIDQIIQENAHLLPIKLDRNAKENFFIYLIDEIFSKVPLLKQFERFDILTEYCTFPTFIRWLEEKFETSQTSENYQVLLFFMAEAFKKIGISKKAMEFYRLSLQINSNTENEPQALVYSRMGLEEIENKNYGNAEQYMRLSLNIWERLYGEKHKKVTQIYLRLGEIKEELKFQQEAQIITDEIIDF